MLTKKFTGIFLKAIEKSPEYHEALDIVKKNSSGNIWVVGGFVYRTIASGLYGLPKPNCDIDFIVQKEAAEIELQDGWRIEKNSFGNLKFVNNGRSIDYVPLNKVFSIIKRGITPTIENYLTGVPLNIQSIAYDIREKMIIGELGIKALDRKIIKVNNLKFAEHAAQKKNTYSAAMVRKTAESLGFTAMLE